MNSDLKPQVFVLKKIMPLTMNRTAAAMSTYDYFLPPELIANRPCAKRDESRLLFFNGQEIKHLKFIDILDLLPSCLLIFNDTKVFHARVPVVKKTGGEAEVFCLEPMPGFGLNDRGLTRWVCLLGGKKIRPQDELFPKKKSRDCTIKVLSKNQMEGVVEFQWSDPKLKFSELLQYLGVVPLPPYIKREACSEDEVRYSTVYAEKMGSVATPTAGLHFTEELLSKLKSKNVQVEKITLHVGAGTFKPVDVEDVQGHAMHQEWFSVERAVLEKIEAAKAKKIPVIAVGTTTTRVLESLVWWQEGSEVGQWEWLEKDMGLGARFGAVLDFLNKNNLKEIQGKTKILLAPGYDFKIIDGLLTNFHQPRSTLLLLIAAFTDSWKKIYEEAIQQRYRFLSYGDACLFFKNKRLDD